MTEPAAPGRWGDGTRVVHAGEPAAVPGAPFLAGPVFAAPYHLGDDPHGADSYARPDNPTLRAFEAALGELEDAPALVLPSGMAATSAVLLSVLRAGDRLVIPSDGYYGLRILAREELAGLGIDVAEVSTVDIQAFAAAGGLRGVRLLVLETPCNPSLDVCDIAAVADLAHAAGALVAVDNTTPTPLGQRPLDLGADVSFASDTKALTGHSDLLLGHVATRDAALAQRIRGWRTRIGAMPGPFEVWLAHRSLATLDLRLTRQAANARAISSALVDHPAVQALRYPGLTGDPSYPLAARQMLRPIGLVGIHFDDVAAAAGFIAASSLISAATSFGGTHTTADRRAQWGSDDVPAGFVRLSCGCEDTADLVSDLLAAADSLGSAG